jgi:lipoprotein-anchoring transpeptidase ErfK/SrfK
MTEILLNQQPARAGRGKVLSLLLVVLVVVGLAIWGWLNLAPGKAAKPVADEAPSSAPAVAPSAAASTAPSAPLENNAPATPETSPATPPDPGPALLSEAQELKRTGKWPEARAKGLEVLDQSTDAAARTQAENLLTEIGMEMLMTPRPMPEKQDYTVQAGDSLDKIARKHGTTVELIQKSNALRGPLIRQGDRLRVFSGAWSIRVNKTRNDLVLYLNGKFFKRYRVGTGEYSKTPVGEFKIVDRIAQPTWWHPDGRTIPFGDPENLLGTHWLALDIKGYGIHGTWEPDTIGRQASMGCVRLVNTDIEELYTLAPIGTPVAIEE